MDERDDGDTEGLDALLRDAARGEPYLDDGGFTANVMARLPAAANPAWRRWVLMGFGGLAVLFGLLVFGGAAFIWDAAIDLVMARHVGPAQVSVLVFAAMFYWSIYTVLGSALGASRE